LIKKPLPLAPVGQSAPQEVIERFRVVVMNYVTQLMHDDVVDAGLGCADELRVEQDAPVFTATAPALFHPALGEVAGVLDAEGGDVLAADF